MRIKKIFLDLDDVLNYCTCAALKYVGCPGVEPTDVQLFNPKWGFNIVTAANWFHPLKTFNRYTFWNAVKRDFWADMEKTPWCDTLLDTCAKMVGRDNVRILTCPIDDPDCAAGKVEWIHRNMPKWMHRQYIITPCKEDCANDHSLLIDDSDKNVDDFRTAGGHAILFPRPWNRLHITSSPEEFMFRELAKYEIANRVPVSPRCFQCGGPMMETKSGFLVCQDGHGKLLGPYPT